MRGLHDLRRHLEFAANDPAMTAAMRAEYIDWAAQIAETLACDAETEYLRGVLSTANGWLDQWAPAMGQQLRKLIDAATPSVEQPEGGEGERATLLAAINRVHELEAAIMSARSSIAFDQLARAEETLHAVTTARPDWEDENGGDFEPSPTQRGRDGVRLTADQALAVASFIAPGETTDFTDALARSTAEQIMRWAGIRPSCDVPSDAAKAECRPT